MSKLIQAPEVSDEFLQCWLQYNQVTIDELPTKRGRNKVSDKLVGKSEQKLGLRFGTSVVKNSEREKFGFENGKWGNQKKSQERIKLQYYCISSTTLEGFPK